MKKDKRREKERKLVGKGSSGNKNRRQWQRREGQQNRKRGKPPETRRKEIRKNAEREMKMQQGIY